MGAIVALLLEGELRFRRGQLQKGIPGALGVLGMLSESPALA